MLPRGVIERRFFIALNPKESEISLLSINAYAPVIRQNIDSFHERLLTEAESWTISTKFGYDTASFTLHGSQDYLTEWFSSGLIRDILMKDRNDAPRWNGFVERMVLNIGGISRTRAISGLANRIILVYTALDTSSNPPKAGAQATITKNETTSQTKYGIKTVTISGGEATAATADDHAFSRINDLAFIRESETQTVGGSSPPTLKVELRGYAHMLDWSNYTQIATSTTDNANTIITAILTADPNGIPNLSTVDLDTNTLQIEKYHDGKTPAWKLIQKIAETGGETGSVGERWVAGLYAGRRLIYKQAEGLNSRGNQLSTNKHLLLTRHMFDGGDRIFDEANREIFPWEVLPDRLSQIVGQPGRAQYIETVKYTAPWNLQLTGTDAINPLVGIVRV